MLYTGEANIPPNIWGIKRIQEYHNKNLTGSVLQFLKVLGLASECVWKGLFWTVVSIFITPSSSPLIKCHLLGLHSDIIYLKLPSERSLKPLIFPQAVNGFSPFLHTLHCFPLTFYVKERQRFCQALFTAHTNHKTEQLIKNVCCVTWTPGWYFCDNMVRRMPSAS